MGGDARLGGKGIKYTRAVIHSPYRDEEYKLKSSIQTPSITLNLNPAMTIVIFIIFARLKICVKLPTVLT